MKKLLATTALICFSISATAEVLTLKQAVTVGIEQSQTLKISQQNIQLARSQTGRARAAVFPTVSASAAAGTKRLSGTASSGASSSVSSSTVDSYSAGIDFTQPLYAGGAMTAGLSQAKANEDLAEQSYLSQKQAAVVAIIKAYYDLVDKTLKFNEAKDNNNILKTYLDITRRYERIGRARNTDRLQAEVTYSDSTIEVETLKNDKYLSEQNIKNLLNLPLDSTIELDLSMQAPVVASLNYQDAIEVALKNNPDLKAAEINIEITNYLKTVDLSQDNPSLNLVGNYGYSSPDRPSLFEDTSNTYGVSLNLKVPIFSGMSSFAKRSNYESQKATQELKKVELRESIETQLRSLIQTIETQRNILVLQETTAKEAVRAMGIILASYQNGTASSNDVVQMQRTRYDAGRKYITAQISYINSVLTLRQLMGIDLYKSYVE